MRTKSIKLIILFLLISISVLFFSYNKNSKNITFDNAYTNKVDRKQFAIFTKEDGEYEPYVSEDSLFPDDYILDIDSSKCYDDKNVEVKPLNDILIQNENSVTVKSNQTLYCTLYFYKEIIPTTKDVIDANSEGQIQESPVAGDTLRRFQGSNETVLNNYICFGTNDLDTCTSTDGQSKYMYRIIGIDVNTNELKVIKKEALEKSYQWDSATTSAERTWNNSDLFMQLNGLNFISSSSYPIDIFLKNEIYVPNENILNIGTKWIDLINDHEWGFGDLPYNSETGIYEKIDASTIFTREKTSWTTGEWHGTANAKIGLMYVSDYYLAVSNTADCRTFSSECAASWIFLNNNDTNPPGYYDWTMTRVGTGKVWHPYKVGNELEITSDSSDRTFSVRPVFYLSSQIILDGDGTIGNPYRIIATGPTIDKVELQNDKGNNFTLKVTASTNAVKYCYKLDNEQEYKCTNSNTYEFTNVDANTNYIVSVYVEDKNELKSNINGIVRISAGDVINKNMLQDVGTGGYGSSNIEGDTLIKRFYGDDPNNYICFGTTANCWNGSTINENFQYRIIGINSDGNIKIIKDKTLNDNYLWHSSTAGTWSTAMLNKQINGTNTQNSSYPYNIFYTNTTLLPESWKKYIFKNPVWCIGDVYTGEYKTGQDVVTHENETCEEIYLSPISLANLSDHYLAHKEGKGEQNCSSSPYCKSWISIDKWEWTMTRYAYQYYAWSMYNGQADNNRYKSNPKYYVRPVFYLESKVKLIGSGSTTDPFIIEGLAS